MDIQGLQFIDTATADAFALANQGTLLVSARDGEVFVLANGASDAAPGIYIYTSSTNSEFAALGNPAMFKGAWSAGAYIVNDIVTHSGATYICKAPVVLADDNPSAATTKWSVLVETPVSAFSSLTGKPTTLSGYGITDGIPAFSAITSKPTTLSGYGITDAYSKTVVDTALNLKANLSAPTFSGTTTVAGITNTGTATGFPYDIALSLLGKPTNAAVLGRFVASRAFTITSTSFNASIAKSAIAATASTVITVKKNGSTVGTITFAAAGTTGTWSYTANGTFAIGDVLTIENQATADATFADAELTILAVTA